MQPNSRFQSTDCPQERLVGHILHFSRKHVPYPFLKKPGGGGKGHVGLVPAQSSWRHLLEGGNQKVERLSWGSVNTVWHFMRNTELSRWLERLLFSLDLILLSWSWRQRAASLKNLGITLLRSQGAVCYHEQAPLSIPACKDFVLHLKNGSQISPICQKRLQVTTAGQFLASIVRWATGFSNKSSRI